MSSLAPMGIPDNFKPKNFWNRPEGKAGWLMLGGIGAGLFLLWGKVAPFVLATIQTTVGIALWGGAGLLLAEIFFGIFGTGIHTLAKNIFQSIARGVTSIFVTIDPIGILKNALEEMKDENRKLLAMIERFTGTLEYLRNKINERDSQFKKLVSEADYVVKMVSQAKDPLEQQKLALKRQTNLENAGLLKSGLENLKALEHQTSDMLHGFQTWSQLGEAKIQRTEFKVDYLSDQRKVILGAKKALSIGQRLLRGNPEQLKLVDMATEYLAEDAANTVGAMREFSHFAEQLQLEHQIEAGAAADSIAAELSQFNQKMLTSANELSASDSVQLPGSNVTAFQPAKPLKSASGFGKMFDE